MSRELLARVWKAGAGPGDAPFTINLDSTICETYGLAKEGARKLAPAQSASASCRVLSRHLARHSHCRPPSVPPKAPADRPPTPVYPNSSPIIAPVTPHPLPLSSRRPSLSIGGFGVKQRTLANYALGVIGAYSSLRQSGLQSSTLALFSS